jgi:hypothetical protein
MKSTMPAMTLVAGTRNRMATAIATNRLSVVSHPMANSPMKAVMEIRWVESMGHEHTGETPV